MIVNTNEVIYDDGRESSIIHFSNNHMHAPIHIGSAEEENSSQLIIFSWCSSKKKGRHQMEVCQMSISRAFDVRRKLMREKKMERFSRKK